VISCIVSIALFEVFILYYPLGLLLVMVNE